MAIKIASSPEALTEAERRRRERLLRTGIQTPPPPQLKQEKSAGSQMVDIASNKAMNKASDTFIDPMINKGMAKAGQLASFVSPQAMTGAQLTSLQAAAPLAKGAGMSPGMAQAILGSGKAAAPLVAKTAGMTGGQLAAATAPGLTGAATASAAGAAGGMAPMLAAMGPVGMAIGAGLLMKKFGLFSKGGQVGPLYSAEGDKVEKNKTATSLLDELKKQLNRKEQKKEDNFLLPSLGPLNKGD